MDQRNAEIEDLIEQQPEQIQELMQALRQLILRTSTSLVETKKWGMPSYGNGKNVCYLQPAKRHVNLGFYQGGTLAETHPELEGTGKEMRHVRITALENIEEEQLSQLVRDALLVSKR